MKWIPNIIGRKGKRNFEISVVQASNAVGRKTVGMFGANKLLISHSGHPMAPPLHPDVWDEVVNVAEKIAEKLNEESR